MNGLLKAVLAAERVDELHDAAHGTEGGDPQHVGVVEIGAPPRRRIWRAARRARHGPGTVPGEHVVLLDVFGALAAGDVPQEASRSPEVFRLADRFRLSRHISQS